MSPIPETQARKSRKRQLPMNWKMPGAIFFGVLWLFILASAAHADGVTYTYTGHSYTTCAGTDVCQGRFPFLTITFTYEPGDVNLAEGVGSGIDITPFLTSFSVSDGTSPVGTPLVITLANAIHLEVVVATSVGGAITAWDIGADTSNCSAASSFAPVGIGGPLESLPAIDVAGCFGNGMNPPFGNGNNMNDPGTWLMGTTGSDSGGVSSSGSGSGSGSGGGSGGSGTTPMPEPAAATMLSLGLFSLMATTLLRKRLIR
jgi:uncharacterized membrane protein YgcG